MPIIGKPRPATYFCKFFFLNTTMLSLLYIIYGCFCTIVAELSSCNPYGMQSLKFYYLVLYRKSVPTPLLKEKKKTVFWDHVKLNPNCFHNSQCTIIYVIYAVKADKRFNNNLYKAMTLYAFLIPTE